MSGIPCMTLADFRATGRDVSAAELEEVSCTDLSGEPGRVYIGSTYIERMPGKLRARGEWCLTIMNESWAGPLSTLEALLYDFARVEVFDDPAHDDEESLLIEELRDFCECDGLPYMSADDLLAAHGASMTPEQRDYVQRFIARWEKWADRCDDKEAELEELDKHCETCTCNALLPTDDLAEALAALRAMRKSFRECIGREAFADFEASNPAVIAADAVIAKHKGRGHAD